LKVRRVGCISPYRVFSVSHLQIDDPGDEVELDAVSTALVAVSLAKDTEYLEARKSRDSI
jgi:hypothetical protein